LYSPWDHSLSKRVSFNILRVNNKHRTYQSSLHAPIVQHSILNHSLLNLYQQRSPAD